MTLTFLLEKRTYRLRRCSRRKGNKCFRRKGEQPLEGDGRLGVLLWVCPFELPEDCCESLFETVDRLAMFSEFLKRRSAKLPKNRDQIPIAHDSFLMRLKDQAFGPFVRNLVVHRAFDALRLDLCELRQLLANEKRLCFREALLPESSVLASNVDRQVT